METPSDVLMYVDPEVITDSKITHVLSGGQNWRADIDYFVPNCDSAFNAYTASCSRLYKQPYEQLSSEQFPKPDDISWIGGKFIDLLNQSGQRDSIAAISFETDNARPIGVCEDAERTMSASLGFRSGGKINTYRDNHISWLDDNGEPVLFQKGFGLGSTIGLIEIGVNGIDYPTGTLFSVHMNKDCTPIDMLKGFTTYSIDDVRRISPLRLSLFALPPEERKTTYKGIEMLSDIDMDIRSAELGKHISALLSSNKALNATTV